MNISAADASYQQAAQLQQSVGIAVAQKTQDATKQQGAAALSLLSDSLALAQQTAVSEPGKGLKIDTFG